MILFKCGRLTRLPVEEAVGDAASVSLAVIMSF